MAKQTREELRAENRQLHAIIRTQQQQIQALSERIGQLEQALAEARRAGKRQAAPFSRAERKTAPSAYGARGRSASGGPMVRSTRSELRMEHPELDTRDKMLPAGQNLSHALGHTGLAGR